MRSLPYYLAIVAFFLAYCSPGETLRMVRQQLVLAPVYVLAVLRGLIGRPVRSGVTEKTKPASISWVVLFTVGLMGVSLAALADAAISKRSGTVLARRLGGLVLLCARRTCGCPRPVGRGPAGDPPVAVRGRSSDAGGGNHPPFARADALADAPGACPGAGDGAAGSGRAGARHLPGVFNPAVLSTPGADHVESRTRNAGADTSTPISSGLATTPVFTPTARG